MATALTVYLTGQASGTLPTANQLYTMAGSLVNIHTYSRVGTATGYGELVTQGTTNPWAAAGSIGNPTGLGFLWDVATLEAQQIIAGNWSTVLRLNCAQNGDANPNVGTLTADIIARTFKRSSSGIYTAITTIILAGQTIPGAFTNFNLPNTSAAVMNFNTGDKLYCDLWLNVAANTNGATDQDVRLNRLSTDTSGLTGDPTVEIVTPGYQITPVVSTGTSVYTPFSAARR